MGQAKQRGTFEERQAAAIHRNEIMMKSLPADKKNPAVRFLKKRNIQQLATRLVQTGRMTTEGRPL